MKSLSVLLFTLFIGAEAANYGQTIVSLSLYGFLSHIFGQRLTLKCTANVSTSRKIT